MHNEAGLAVYHLRFLVEARDPIHFGAQAGAQLRGALYEALRVQTCAGEGIQHDPRHAEHCPVCWLMAREAPTARRGKDVPRPFTIRPPYGGITHYPPGTRFQFGMTLFGSAFRLFPYVALALPQMAKMGIGADRGRFELCAVEGVDLLTGRYEVLMQPGFRAVHQPKLWVTPNHIKAQAGRLSPHRLTLRFVTPTRLTEKSEPVRIPEFRIVIARLLERVDMLRAEYGGETITSPYDLLTAAAHKVNLVKDCTVWQEIRSHSARTGTNSPISGFIGEATYEGYLAPFLPWLLWGQCVQIGKDTVKGNGVMELVEISA